MVASKKKFNHTWKRIKTTRTDPIMQERADRNANTFKDPIFIRACESFGVKLTTRQASKWNRKKGLAYKFVNDISGT